MSTLRDRTPLRTERTRNAVVIAWTPKETISADLRPSGRCWPTSFRTSGRRIRPSRLPNQPGCCLIARVIAAVVLNAIFPGLGHAVLGRWIAAIRWCILTMATYLAGVVALVYAANFASFDRFWRFGELRVLASFLLPGVVVHTWCCVSVLGSAAERRLAIACAAAGMLLLLLAAPSADLGLRRQMKSAAEPALPR
jgi:hypothetical protein